MSGWCSSQMFPKLKAELTSPSDDLVQYWLSRKNLYLDDTGLLWRKRASLLEFDQLVVPHNLRQKLFDDCHNGLLSGHLGVSRTYARLNMHFYWPGMTDFVPTHIRACPDCLARKSPNNRREPMGHVSVSSKWERVAMDVLDITTVSDRGNRYILVVADYFTKYTETYPLIR